MTIEVVLNVPRLRGRQGYMGRTNAITVNQGQKHRGGYSTAVSVRSVSYKGMNLRFEI